MQLLKTHDYVDAIWQPAEVLPLLPLVTAPAFIQSGYFDFMLQVRRFEFALQRPSPALIIRSEIARQRDSHSLAFQGAVAGWAAMGRNSHLILGVPGHNTGTSPHGCVAGQLIYPDNACTPPYSQSDWLDWLMWTCNRSTPSTLASFPAVT